MPLAAQRRISAETISKVFAANRAVGSVAFETVLSAGKTRRGKVHEAGSLRVRFPSPETRALAAVLVNTAGGVAGGDRFSVSIDAGRGHRADADHGGGGEDLPFAWPVGRDRRLAARGRRRAPRLAAAGDDPVRSRKACRAASTSSSHESASLLLAEIVVFGRAAMGEAMREGEYVDRWRLQRARQADFRRNAAARRRYRRQAGAARPSPRAARRWRRC